MVIVFFFIDDFLHFVTAVLLHCLHICRGGQMLPKETQGRVCLKVPAHLSLTKNLSYLDQTQCVQTKVEISKQEERERSVAAV